MKAYIENGQVFDLGSDYIRIVGDPGDGTHVLIDHVRGELRDSSVKAFRSQLEAPSSENLIDLTTGTGNRVLWPTDAT